MCIQIKQNIQCLFGTNARGIFDLLQKRTVQSLNVFNSFKFRCAIDFTTQINTTNKFIFLLNINIESRSSN